MFASVLALPHAGCRGPGHGAGSFLSPVYITGSFSASSDSDLDGVNIGSFINLHGGTLDVTSTWNTSRTISVLSGGGTINLNGYFVVGPTRGNGVLTLTGPLGMAIEEPAHTGGTVVTDGTLLLLDGAPTHTAPITVSGGVLAGSGSTGSINSTSGALSPGTLSPGDLGIIQATNLTLSPSASYIVDLNANTGPGAGHDQLDVTGLSALNGAQLTIRLNFNPTGATQFTIVTNVSGTFNGLPEGATFFAGAQRFRITYVGGDGNDVVLTADDAPGSSTLGPQTISENRVMGPIDFTISDDLTPAGSLPV